MSSSRLPGWSSSGSVTSSRSSMASSRSLSARSGSFTIGKGVTSLALDALKFALDGAEINQEGDRFVHLQSELGERRYTKLCEDVDLALEEIHYCQEGLDIVRINARAGDEIMSPAQVEQMRQMKDLINHDYLVLKLRAGEPKAEVLHIMAHKLRGGIHITHIPSNEVTSVFHEGVRCFTVDCSKKRMRLEALLAILKEEDPDYSLRNANCWDYAKNTAKRLVKGCVDAPGISSAEKARLQTEHDNLEANLTFRHIQNVAKSLLRNLSTRARVSTSSVPSRPRVSQGLFDHFPQVVEHSTDAMPSRALSVSNSPEVFNSLRSVTDAIPSRALSVSNSPEVFNSLRSVEHSTDAIPSRALPVSNSAEVVDSARSVEHLVFSNPAGLNSFRALNSLGAVDSPELLSSLSAPRAPLVSSGKLCLQIVFLVFCLVINNLGLGPWASALLGGSNSG